MISLDPENTLFNTIIFYIIIILVILIIKPPGLYCYDNKKFKSFGFGKNKTIFPFPAVVLSSGITLYMFFLGVEILSTYLDN
jgi:hypothetical protein